MSPTFPLIISGLFAVSSATLSAAILMFLQDILSGLSRSLWWGQARRRFMELARQSHEETGPAHPPTLEELYGLPRVSWPALMLACGVVGLAISISVFQLVPLMQMAGVTAAALPVAVRSYLRARGQRRLRHQVQRFITDLRLSLAFVRSLGQSLYRLAGDVGSEAPDPRGILFTRLRQYLRTRMMPEEILEHLASDLRSDELRELLERVDAATRGNETYANALQAVSVSMWTDEVARADEEIQSAGTRMILPMVGAMMGPLLVMVLLPAVARLLAGLTVASH
jgi:hypothetical protein